MVRIMADIAKNKAPDEISDIADGLRALADHALELEQRLRHACNGRETPPPRSTGPGRGVRHPVDPELYDRVRKMLTEEPMRLAQIVEATGLHENKIKVLITKMQREGIHIMNLGAANKALWFIPGPKALKRIEHMDGDDD